MVDPSEKPSRRRSYPGPIRGFHGEHPTTCPEKHEHAYVHMYIYIYTIDIQLYNITYIYIYTRCILNKNI